MYDLLSIKIKMIPLGPTLRNLNRNVEKNGNVLNQLTHLQTIGLLNSFQLTK